MNMFYESVIWEITKAEADKRRLRRMSDENLENLKTKLDNDTYKHKLAADSRKVYSDTFAKSAEGLDDNSIQKRAYNRASKIYGTLGKGHDAALKLREKTKKAVDDELKLRRRNHARDYAKRAKRDENEWVKDILANKK